MERFISSEFFSRELTHVNEYENHAVVSLREALAPVKDEIVDLPRYIDWAVDVCHHPSSEKLTLDESAAIYLYTMDMGTDNLYRLLNDALRERDPNALTPWNKYLKLLTSALDKLPSIAMNVWRGVDADIAKNYRKGTEITWWTINSCSKSLKQIEKFIKPTCKSTVLLIEGKNFKDISKYSALPEEEEVILRLGTKLRVKNDVFEQPSMSIVHLIEITDDDRTENGSPLSSTTPKSKDTSKTETETLMKNMLLTAGIQSSKVLGKTTVALSSQEKITYPNGAIYTGEVVNKIPEGKGIYMCFSSGQRYEGEFKNGKQHGKGTSTFRDGGKYQGEFAHGLPDGQGVLLRPDGFQYEGQFVKGKRHGKGTCTYPNGGRYSGSFAHGHPNGYGTYKLPNGYRYDGQFVNGRQQGKGVSIFPDGGKYDGEFINGFPEGIGFLHRPDGYQYHGQFSKGKRHGNGQCQTPDGVRYSGEFSNGFAHGKGVYISPNGLVHEGNFINGALVGFNNVNHYLTHISFDSNDNDGDTADYSYGYIPSF